MSILKKRGHLEDVGKVRTIVRRILCCYRLDLIQGQILVNMQRTGAKVLEQVNDFHLHKKALLFGVI